MDQTILIDTLDHFIGTVIPEFFAPSLRNTLYPSQFVPASTSGSVEQSTSGTGRPSLPRFESSIVNFDRVEGYNYRALQLAPRIGARRGDVRSYAGGDLRPILVNLQVTFRTNEQTDILAVVDALFVRTVAFQFITEMRDPDDAVVLSFHNRAALDLQFSPEDAPDSGQGPGYSLQFQVALSTQTGRLVSVPSVLRTVHRAYTVSGLDLNAAGASPEQLATNRAGDPVTVQSAGVQSRTGDIAAEIARKT